MDEEPYIRVDGKAECSLCGLTYRKHKVVVRFTETGEEVWFRRSCDGILLKL